MPKSLDFAWKILKNQIINKGTTIAYYDLVYVILNEEGNYLELPLSRECTDYKTPVAFTETSKMAFAYTPMEDNISRPELPQNIKFKAIMLGELAKHYENKKNPQAIKINPILSRTGEYLCEEVIFAPLCDPHTKKLLLTDPEEARALYAINPADQERYGLETVFYIQTNRGLPIDDTERGKILKDKIEQLNFIIPRTPIKKGSASFFVIILDLENEMEETAFIRPYKTMDNYVKVLCLDSNLKLYTGDLTDIPYLGYSVDDLFNGLIHWNKTESFTQNTLQ